MARSSIPTADNLFLVQRLLGISNGSTECKLSDAAGSRFRDLFTYPIVLVNVSAQASPESFAISTIDLSRLPAVTPQSKEEWANQISTRVFSSKEMFRYAAQVMSRASNTIYMRVIYKYDNAETIEAKNEMSYQLGRGTSEASWKLETHIVFSEAVRHVVLHTPDIDMDTVLCSIQPEPPDSQSISDGSRTVLLDLIKIAVGSANVCIENAPRVTASRLTVRPLGPPVADAPTASAPPVRASPVNAPVVNTLTVNTPAVNTPTINTPGVNHPAVNTPAVHSPAINPLTNNPRPALYTSRSQLPDVPDYINKMTAEADRLTDDLAAWLVQEVEQFEDIAHLYTMVEKAVKVEDVIQMENVVWLNSRSLFVVLAQKLRIRAPGQVGMASIYAQETKTNLVFRRHVTTWFMQWPCRAGSALDNENQGHNHFNENVLDIVYQELLRVN